MKNLRVKWVATLSLLLVICGASAQAKDKFKKATHGEIKITTKQEDAVVRVNGVERGRGTEVTVSNLPPGTYDVEVVFSPTKSFRQSIIVEAGKRNCLCLNYVKRTPLPPPCPYEVQVSSPSVANDGELITFVTDVGYAGTGLLSYSWSVSPASARIVRGAGTNTITVDSTSLGGQSITATVVVDDGSGDVRCRQMSQVTVPVTPLPPPERPRLFDEFPNVAFDDSKARLDLYAIELQGRPDAMGYVFVYGGRTSRPGQVDKVVQRTLDYMTKRRGIPASRLVIANGGYREIETYELWIVPQGATLPQPSPTVAPSEVTPPKGKVTRPRATSPNAKPTLKKRTKGDEE